MRFILGIIVGVMLTIGGAYVYDGTKTTVATEASARPMVNWDVVGTHWDSLTLRARHEWDRLRANIDEKRASQG